MKNRRILVVAFLCFAMLVTAVGYAAVSQTLTINGIGKYDPDEASDVFKDHVYFSSGEKVSYQSTGDYTADIVTTTQWGRDVTMVGYEVESLLSSNDWVIFKFTITNENTQPVHVTLTHTHSVNPTNATNPYTCHYYSDSACLQEATTLEIAAATGETADTFGKVDVYVKVVLEDVIDDIVTVNQTLTMVVTPINN